MRRGKIPTKILVFTEGTLLIFDQWAGLSREEIVRLSSTGEQRTDFGASIPVGSAVAKLETWKRQGAGIAYLTSRRSLEEVQAIRVVLDRFGFPPGELFYRQEGESYDDAAARAQPDVIVEDDCQSIGGEAEMTYPHLPAGLKARIISVVVPEFGGIDHLPDDISAL